MVFIKNIYKIVFLFTMFLISLNLVSAAGNVIDVSFNENVHETVRYDPLGATTGLYADTNENQSLYSLNGTILIKNNHQTEPVENIVINISPISNVYNVAFSSGANAIVTDFNVAGDYMIIVIPDLGAGQNSTLSYDINTTNVAPPINLTTSYSNSKIFAGLNLGITNNIQNTLNATNYPINCIYDINITENSLEINSSGNLFNITFNATNGIAGLDSSNASIATTNRTLSWNVWNKGCFYSTNTTDINYKITTPATLNDANTYTIINSTIRYKINTTLSRLSLVNVNAYLDLELGFEKYQVNALTGDNATWRIIGNITNPTNITVNLTEVTYWVSVRDGTGTGFTDPSKVDNDSISGVALNITINPNQALNSSLGGWDNNGSPWLFNYTYSASPIVWMDLINNIIDDGVQITNRSITYSDNSIYIKDVYIATGYWLTITKNITRLADNNYSVDIKVRNLGTAPTPKNQAVVVYNFIPIAFNLTSNFTFSSSTWYTTDNTSEVLTDVIYNGTMHQFALLAQSNPSNSSLDKLGAGESTNNTWTVSYNLTGSGQFNFDDLFLTGVDPLNVGEFGATKSLTMESMYNFVSSKVEYVLIGVAAGIGVLLFII